MISELEAVAKRLNDRGFLADVVKTPEEAKELIKYLCTIVPDADIKMMHAITNTDKYGLWDRMRLKQARGEEED